MADNVAQGSEAGGSGASAADGGEQTAADPNDDGRWQAKSRSVLMKTDAVGGKMQLPKPNKAALRMLTGNRQRMVEWSHVVPDVDWDPGMAPKSVAGALCSNFWRLVYLLLAGVALYRLVDSSNVGTVAGDEAWVWFNHHCHETNEELNTNIAKGDLPVIKLPTFKARIHSKLTQYEEDRPSIQKVQLIDDTGYLRHPVSSTARSVPGVKSAVQKIKLPLNSFDEELSKVAPVTHVSAHDLDSTFARAAAHRFTSETLKARYQELGIFAPGDAFYNHTCHLFARFDPNQLKKLKPCQLQVFMVNAGEMKVNAGSDLLTNRLESLESDPYTWTPQNWLGDTKTGARFKHALSDAQYQKLRQKAELDSLQGLPLDRWPKKLPPFNLLSMKKRVVRSTGSMGNGYNNNWKFGVTYVNSFNHVFDRTVCDGESLQYDQTAEQLALAPGLKDDTLHVLGSPHMGPGYGRLGLGYVVGDVGGPAVQSCTFQNSRCPVPPFYIMISSWVGKERVKVTGLSDCAPSPGVCRLSSGKYVPAKDKAGCSGLWMEGDHTVSCKTLTIQRGKQPVDHAKPPPVSTKAWEAGAVDEPFPLLAPVEWACSPGKYWAGDACDCGCGAFDPDCLEFGNEVRGCRKDLNEQCSLLGTCVVRGFLEIIEELDNMNSGVHDDIDSWVADSLKYHSEITRVRGTCSGAAVCTAVTALENATACNATEIVPGKHCKFIPGCDSVKMAGNKICDIEYHPGNLQPKCGYDGGDCLDVDSGLAFGLVFLSIECEEMYESGEVQIAGFVGTESEFQQDGATCSVCPGDPYFGGKPTRDAHGKFVCDNAPSAVVDTKIDFMMGQQCTAKAGRPCAVNEMGLEMYAEHGTPFPSPASCTGQANEEVVYVQAATPAVRGKQTLLVSASKSFKAATCMHNYDMCDPDIDANCRECPEQHTYAAISSTDATACSALGSTCKYTAAKFKKSLTRKHNSRGNLLSAVSPDSMTVIVQPSGGYNASTNKWSGYTFDAVGPYTLYIRGASITVASATTNARDKVPHQILQLAKPPKYLVGSTAILLEDTDRETQTLYTIGADYRYSWRLLGVFAPTIAVVDARNGLPMTTQVENVWPSAWQCPIEQFNDGIYCNCNCGIFDPDCGRVRSGKADGYWYVNPALKRCKAGDISILDNDVLGELTCKVAEFTKDGEYNGEHDWSKVDDPAGNPKNLFGFVTWDNLDLDRDGTYEFRSGDCVPSGTNITLGGPGGAQGSGKHPFNPYTRDHDADGKHDVRYVHSPVLKPADNRPPVHTPPYHPSTVAKFGPPPLCKATATSFLSDSDCEKYDLHLCETDEGPGTGECQIVRPSPDGTACPEGGGGSAGCSDFYYGTDYRKSSLLRHEMVGDLPDMTKWQKAHPAGADVGSYFSNCGKPACTGSPACSRVFEKVDASDRSKAKCQAVAGCTYIEEEGCISDSECDCLKLHDSWRQPSMVELPTKQWEAGSVLLLMDSLVLKKGYYLRDSVQKGTRITTSAMGRLPYYLEHSHRLINRIPSFAKAFGVDPEDIPPSVLQLKQDYFGRQLSRYFTVKMLRREAPFLPSQRHKPTKAEPTDSPETLDIDLSVFTVPERVSFAEGLNYCPSFVGKETVPYLFSSPQPGPMTTWKIRSGRELTVSYCKHDTMKKTDDGCIDPKSMKSRYPGQYRAKCSTDMPPTHTFTFGTEMFCNNKWLYDGVGWSGYKRPDNGKYPAEYHLQISHVYSFSHSLLDDEIENVMAEGMPATKDSTQGGKKLLYTGAAAYRGLGRRGSASAKASVPATSPYLESTVEFFLAPEALDDVMNCKAKYWIPTREWAQARLNNFPSFNVSWDYSLVGGSNGQLLLEPGYKYTLTAVVSVSPYFSQGRFEMVYIEDFKHKVISTTVEKVKTDYFTRREARVTYVIQFDDSAFEWIVTHNYPVSAFLSDILALTIVMGAASLCMKVWHKFKGTPTKVVLEQHTTGIERHSSGKEGEEEFPNPLSK